MALFATLVGCIGRRAIADGVHVVLVVRVQRQLMVGRKMMHRMGGAVGCLMMVQMAAGPAVFVPLVG